MIYFLVSFDLNYDNFWAPQDWTIVSGVDPLTIEFVQLVFTRHAYIEALDIDGLVYINKN